MGFLVPLVVDITANKDQSLTASDRVATASPELLRNKNPSFRKERQIAGFKVAFRSALGVALSHYSITQESQFCERLVSMVDVMTSPSFIHSLTAHFTHQEEFK